MPRESQIQDNWPHAAVLRGTTIQRMKTNELPKVLQRATTLLVPVGTYHGDPEAYTVSEGLVIVTKEDRVCCSIVVQDRVTSLFSALGMTEMFFLY